MGQNIATTGKKRRVSTNKSPEPSYAIIDSQSVKTCGAAEDKGFDGGKKVKGRKRHIVVDPMGNLLGVVVHAAHIHDIKAGIFAAQKAIEAPHRQPENPKSPPTLSINIIFRLPIPILCPIGSLKNKNHLPQRADGFSRLLGLPEFW